LKKKYRMFSKRSIGFDLPNSWEPHGRVLFVAEQLRFSDSQVSQLINFT
jgi:hypothetical protein